MLWSSFRGREIPSSMLEEMFPIEIDIDSPYKDAISVMREHNIIYKGKTITSIFYQINWKLLEEFEKVEKMVPNCTVELYRELISVC